MFSVIEKADFLSHKLSSTVLEYSFQYGFSRAAQMGCFSVREMSMEKSEHHS